MKDIFDKIFRLSHGREGTRVVSLIDGEQRHLTHYPVMQVSEYRKFMRTIPILNGILTFEWEDNVMFANLKDPEIRIEVFRDTKLFPILDRMVHYMIANGKDSLYFKDEVYSRDKDNQVIMKDYNLRSYNTETVYKQILKDVCTKLGEPPLSRLEGDYEYLVMVQGIETKVISWNDLHGRELIIQVLPPTRNLPQQVEQLLKSKKGILMLNKDLVRNLHQVLNDGIYKRVAYRDLGSTIGFKGQLSSSFTSKTSIEDLRNRDYDVYVINLEKVEDIKELLFLPVNKLCVLTIPTNDVKKALSYLSIFRNDPITFDHLIDNMLGIIAGNKEYLALDNWSRELIRKEKDIETVLDKLNTTFIIRDNVDLSDRLSIKEEIKAVLVEADRVGASNIDICPGSPIRLYQSKSKYVNYSNVRMTPNLVEIMILNMISPKEIDQLYSTGDLDTSYSLGGVGRYRLGIMKQRSSLAVSIRRVPRNAPKAEDLGIPDELVEEVLGYDQGIFMVVGEPNSGKTTTFNCLVSEANRRMGGIIFLMGNPIEFTHRHDKALVLQAEVGKDLPSYTHGMAKALRMNTSLLGFEELRTKEEFAALGALINSPNAILMTSHAGSVRQAIENLVERIRETGISQSKAQEDIANALNCVMYQRLVDYEGRRVLIYEKAVITPSIRNTIRKGNFSQLEHTIATDPKCETLDDVILRRIEEGALDFETAKPYIKNISKFEVRGYN